MLSTNHRSPFCRAEPRWGRGPEAGTSAVRSRSLSVASGAAAAARGM